MTALPPGLVTWADKPGPAKLLDVARLRARRGHQTEAGTLTTLTLTADERRDVGLLLGTRWAASGKPVRLQDLAAALAEHGQSVRGFVENIDGAPIVPDRDVRLAAEAAAEAEEAQVVGVLGDCGITQSHVAEWLTDSGLPRPGDGDLADLAGQVRTVWRALPASGDSVRLAQLAADTRHDAHALDNDRLLGRATARLIAIVHGRERPRRAGKVWRDTWYAAGVICDGVSSRVLVLNLPMRGSAPAVQWCNARLGEPLWLTLRSLSDTWNVAAGTTVFVCENVTVVEAAADALTTACPPMVCTDGMPSGAALDLLSGLAGGGCDVRYRADFDSAGLVIADQIRSAAPSAEPWRFDAETYLGVLGQAAEHLELAPEPHAVLRATFDRYATVVHEERLLDGLLTDLRRAASRP